MALTRPAFNSMLKESVNRNKGMKGGADVTKTNDAQSDSLLLDAQYNLEKESELSKYDSNIPDRKVGGRKRKPRRKKRKTRKKTRKQRRRKTKRKTKRKTIRKKRKTKKKRMGKLRFSKMVPLKF